MRRIVVDTRALELSPVIDGHNDWAWELQALPRLLRRRPPGPARDAHRHRPAPRRPRRRAALERLRRGPAPGTRAAKSRSRRRSSRSTGAPARGGVPGRLRARAVGRGRRGRPRLRPHRLPARCGGRAQHRRLPGVLRMLAALGVRYLTLTHNRNSTWADSATDEPVARRAHRPRPRLHPRAEPARACSSTCPTSRATTMHAALDVATAPVIFSHSSGPRAERPPAERARRRARPARRQRRRRDAHVRAAVPRRGVPRLGPGRPGGAGARACRCRCSRTTSSTPGTSPGSGTSASAATSTASMRCRRGSPASTATRRCSRELAGRGWSAADLAGLAGANVLRVLRETDEAFAGRRSRPRSCSEARGRRNGSVSIRPLN